MNTKNEKKKNAEKDKNDTKMNKRLQENKYNRKKDTMQKRKKK